MKSLNIKDPEAHRLAELISRKTGESMTQVVVGALRERLQHLQNRRKRASLEELLAIANRVSAQVKGPYLDHAALLYNEDGLPQ